MKVTYSHLRKIYILKEKTKQDDLYTLSLLDHMFVMFIQRCPFPFVHKIRMCLSKFFLDMVEDLRQIFEASAENIPCRDALLCLDADENFVLQWMRNVVTTKFYAGPENDFIFSFTKAFTFGR